MSTDAKGQVTKFTYDALGRVLTKTSLFGTPQAATTTNTYDEARATFFNVGYITTAANAAATLRYNYDQAGHLKSQDYVIASTTYTITNGFDAGDRLLWRQYPDGDSVGSAGSPFLYDSAGRLKSIPGVITDTAYNALGQVTTLTRANGVTTTYGYQASRRWLTDIDTLAGATVLQDINYGHDAAGRITGTTSSITGESWTYGYDDMDRLLSADNVNNNALDQSFTYDTVGNLSTNSLIGTYTYPATGSPRPHAVTATPLGSYGYDANGSMTTAAGDTLAYDGENRLVSVNGVQFVYGPDGARLKKIAGATTTICLGADIEIVGTTETKYLPGGARRVGLSTTTWVHRDNLTSFRVESDGTGAVAWRANYRPYGERLVTVAGVTESKGFIGERHDDETGLLYLNARYYDPVLARFIQADPSDPSQPGVGPNRYTYAGGNPIGALDPSGLVGVPLPSQNFVYPAGGPRVQIEVNIPALSIGPYIPYNSGWGYLEPALNVAQFALQPYIDVYENFFVGPFQTALTTFLESPLGDLGLYASLQGMGPPGTIIGGLGEVGVSGLRTLAGIGKTGTALPAESTAVRGLTGEFYSVAFETKLSPTSYPGVSRGAHFQEANESLLKAMEWDPDFTLDMQSLGVNLERTPMGLAPRTSPAGFTWHHAPEPGVMQLVPRSQHAPGSIFQDALHPDGRGGYSIWGE
ncbi:hypothetical protein FRZ44_17320 [Hypericibacter terrae]|uniref:Type IV secretion protein Rhs n=1 Tax=Hypericibacter terrae TaxID=2602015 RepID=A0A5J6MGA5_9PROT|nr:RHS repeat-associated core domain-containing protein [Hypericibacter terrae]QEX16439.1 hypothetical protein FRZ44_17320 [Hypericibacter terrae]